MQTNGHVSDEAYVKVKGEGPAAMVCSTWSLPGEKLEVVFVTGLNEIVAYEVEL